MNDIIVGNVCSLCAAVTDSISGTRKKRNSILAFQTLSQVFYGVGTIILKGYSSTVQNGVAILRNFAAMKRIQPDIQVVLNENRKSRVIVLLGSDALKKLLPTARPVRGKWIQLNGVPAVMTFSPDYIFSNFQAGSPHERQAKSEMWEDIKSALARLPA